MNKENFLNELNEMQKLGVTTTDGPVLVVAGAGSGKTKMLTYRIVNLIVNHNVLPQNILAVTFTNKAAEEMKTRILKALNYDYSVEQIFYQPMIGTFHSVCVKILRREIESTPFTKQFVIYDEQDQLTLIKSCFEKLNISEKNFNPKSFLWGIHKIKSEVKDIEYISKEAFDPYTRNLVLVYKLYQEELYKNNALDFDEILNLTYKIFLEKKEILEKYQNLWQYIHVDEYQDTNRLQYLLIKLLASKTRNLFVVGDEDQSIYKWRGADIRNILDFEKDYQDAKIIKLEENYRSTKNIVEAASAVISNNTTRKEKKLWTQNHEGDKISYLLVSDEKAESLAVAKIIKQMMQTHNYVFDDFALFYRTNAQSRVFEDVFLKEKIPYKVIGGMRFYDRKEIKDVLSYFKVLINDSDSISLKRIINVPARGIGKTTIEKIESYAFEKNLSFYLALRESLNFLSGAAKNKVFEFLKLLDELKALASVCTLTEFYHELLDRTGYVLELKKENTDEAQSRIENLQEFNSVIEDFEEKEKKAIEVLPSFLEKLSLETDADAKLWLGGAVQMMTLHTSKGLEFPVVFIVGLEEGLFPSLRDEENEMEAIEEERRLFYVGMTRAQKKLFLTSCVCRRIYGNIIYNDRARFIDEVPPQYLDFHDLSGFYGNRGFLKEAYANDDFEESGYTHTGFEYRGSLRKEQERYGYASAENFNISQTGLNQASFGQISSSQNIVGKKVRHQIYGEGIIRSVEGEKITVEFKNRVIKKFIEKFANLEYLN
jgi:DNA helicase-2/ATP-dependent DNA helicase PcrA